MELRGTPGLGRILALPVGSFGVALGSVLAWTVLRPERWLGLAALSAAVFGVYAMARALRQLARQRRAADDWLRTATTGFVPPAYAWRAAQLTSARERRMLARTLGLIEQMAYERPAGRLRPLYLPAVRAHCESLRGLARALARLEEPVTPAGMLRVVDLVTDGASPVWAPTPDAALGEAISSTLEILRPCALDSRAA